MTGIKKEVLIIDDESSVRDMLADYLVDSGYSVYQAESGEKGIKVLRAHQPHVVLLDLSMPGIGGIVVLGKIAAEFPDTPVIIVSGKGEMGDAIEALRLGAWDFITKPFHDLAVLGHAMEKTLERLELIRLNREYENDLERLVSQKTKALQESEEKYRALFFESRDALTILDPGRTFISGNPSAVKLFGCVDEEELKSKTILDLSPQYQPDSQLSSTRYKEMMAITLEKGTHFFEWKYKRLKGEEFFATVLFTRMILKNQLVFLATIRDISVQKKTEAAFIQLQKMETVGALAGGLVHDFNNVLGGIIGLLSTLSYKLRKNDPIEKHKLGEYIDLMEESGKRASNLVKQLLTLSQKQELRFEAMDLNDTVKHVMKLCLNTVDKSVKLDPIYLPGPAMIKANPNQMEQVLLQISINAAHAMTYMRPQEEDWGGTLRVSIESFSPGESFYETHPTAERGDYWMLIVEDSGVGIHASMMPKIFDPFFTTKGKELGSGIGLPMVYIIVKQHYGLIDVYSEPGVGTRFKIFLPAIREEDYSDHGGEKKRISPGEGLILNIDDDKVMRLAAQEILKESGYEVIEAANGMEGISIFSRRFHEISGVLLDISMPEMSGNEVYARLKEIDPSVKVLLTSGLWKDKRIDDALSMGAKLFLQKPYTMEKLGKAMETVVNS
ncbi:MAG: response regulator [bacterium]|nr:response regulator [bacterium]